MKSTTNTKHTSTLKKTIRPRGLRRWAFAGALALTSLSAAFAQPSYFITELPAPAGYDTTVP